VTRIRKLFSSWPVRLLISAGLLGVVVSQLDVEALLRGLVKAHPAQFVAAIGAVAVMRVFAAARMGVVLQRHLVQLRLIRVFTINLRAAFFSFFLPGHLAGGVVRWQLLTRQGASGADALTAIGFDRLNDFSALVLTGFACSLLSQDMATPMVVPFLLGSVLAGTLILQFVVLSEGFVAGSRVVGSRLGLMKWGFAARAFEKLVVSARAFHTLPLACRAQIWGWSLASNVAGLVSYYWLAGAVDLDLGVFELGWVRSAITALGMLPLTLSGLGVREGVMIPLLAGYGITPVVAVTFSLLLFIRGVVVALAGGLLVAYDVLVGRGWQTAARRRSAS
jgi:uncharacterized membrane protein YbhN (UPF0104 family)